MDYFPITDERRLWNGKSGAKSSIGPHEANGTTNSKSGSLPSSLFLLQSAFGVALGEQICLTIWVASRVQARASYGGFTVFAYYARAEPGKFRGRATYGEAHMEIYQGGACV